MGTFSIHALEGSVEQRIRAKARRDGKSLNQTMKELLAASVGGHAKPGADKHNEFAEFCGVWTAREAAEFKAATADLETIDRTDWA